MRSKWDGASGTMDATLFQDSDLLVVPPIGSTQPEPIFDPLSMSSDSGSKSHSPRLEDKLENGCGGANGDSSAQCFSSILGFMKINK